MPSEKVKSIYLLQTFVFCLVKLKQVNFFLSLASLLLPSLPSSCVFHVYILCSFVSIMDLHGRWTQQFMEPMLTYLSTVHWIWVLEFRQFSSYFPLLNSHSSSTLQVYLKKTKTRKCLFCVLVSGFFVCLFS